MYYLSQLWPLRWPLEVKDWFFRKINGCIGSRRSKTNNIYPFWLIWVLCWISRWPPAAILNFENANKETVRDSSDIDSRHIELTFLKFSSFYIFVPFKHIKNSNTLGLLILMLNTLSSYNLIHKSPLLMLLYMLQQKNVNKWQSVNLGMFTRQSTTRNVPQCNAGAPHKTYYLINDD